MPLSNEFATLIATKLHDPARYAKRFDSRFGPGSACSLLRRATEVSLTAVGREFKRTKEWARQSYYMLGGKRGKLAAVRRPQEFINLLRPDVTLEKILRLANGRRSKNEIAAILRCSLTTFDHRLGGRAIEFPKHRPPRKRPDVTVAVVRREARFCSSVRQMTKRLKVSHITIQRRAREGDILLPNGWVGPKPKTIHLLERTAHYRRQGWKFLKIARVMRRPVNTIKATIWRHRGRYYKFLAEPKPKKAA